jgi:uncharacterized protein YijF (DUF1287 family)
MTQLSSAAQTVLDAINKELDEAPWDVSFLAGVSAAAVLRAAADQTINVQRSVEMWVLHQKFHAIATELEAL